MGFHLPTPKSTITRSANGAKKKKKKKREEI